MGERHTRQGDPTAAVSRVRGIDDYEDPDRPARKSARGGSALNLPTIALGGCWCGAPNGHDWPGKSQGNPHPRNMEGTS